MTVIGLYNKIRATPEWRNCQSIAESLREHYCVADMKPEYIDVSAFKYLFPDQFLTRDLNRAEKLGLIGSPPKRVVDIGTGTATFPFVCKQLGHKADAFDTPLNAGKDPGMIIYQSLSAALGVKVLRHMVHAMRPLPFARKYDLITAFRVVFNKTPHPWGVNEWQFFVEDAMRDLTQKGRLVMELNKTPAYGDFYTNEIREYFESVGRVDGSWVFVDAK